MVREIPVSSFTRPDLVALVDDEDAELVSGHAWYATEYACAKVDHQVILMHRLILDCPHGRDGFRVRHKDGNRFNNQRSNLVIVDYWAGLYGRPIRPPATVAS